MVPRRAPRRVRSMDDDFEDVNFDADDDADDVLHHLNQQMKASAKKRQTILMNALRYEMRKQKIVDEYYDAMATEYAAIAKEKHDSLDALGRLNDDRLQLEMHFVLMDIVRDLDVLQKDLETLRHHDDLQYTPLRNTAGLFFKNLYTNDYRTAARTDHTTRRLMNTMPDTWRIVVALALGTVALILAVLVVTT